MAQTNEVYITEDLEESLFLACATGDVVRLESCLASVGCDISVIEDQSGSSLLYKAIEDNQLNVTELLLHAGFDVVHDLEHLLNCAASTGNSEIMKLLLSSIPRLTPYILVEPLQIASHKGHLAVVELLLASGADINRDSPLSSACEGGHLHVARALLAARAHVDRDDEAPPPLLCAAAAGHTALVELLLGLGADREAFLGETSLFEAACEGGCAGLVKQLLAEAAVDPEELPQDSLDICLSAAAGRGRAEVVELLLDAGARVDSMAMGKAAVISALQRGHVDAAKALLAAGARVHERGLMCAAMGGAVELVTLMLARGADVNLQEGLGQTALSYASEPAVVRALLAAKADVNPDQGLSVLTGSCVELNLESINILLDAKAGVDGSAPRTPLQVALESSRRRERPEALVAVVEALLGAGARVTGLGKGATALQVLAGLDPTPATGRVAQLLVAAGPEAVDAVDGAGVSVLAVAVARENGPLVDELLRARADVNLCRDRHQRTLLMEVRPTRLRQVRALLQAGADVNARCETGRTPLFYAVSVQVHARQWPFHRECARLLLVAGADPALEDQQGATALMAALSRKNRVTDADIVGLIHDIVELAYSMHRPNHRSRGNSKGI